MERCRAGQERRVAPRSIARKMPELKQANLIDVDPTTCHPLPACVAGRGHKQKMQNSFQQKQLTRTLQILCCEVCSDRWITVNTPLLVLL